MTMIRLAAWGSAKGFMVPTFSHANKFIDTPSVLVTYLKFEGWLRSESSLNITDWVLDSGAYSAHTQGIDIDLKLYTRHCANLLYHNPRLSEVFALDVIGDWKASLKNTDYMWRRGVEATPCYHQGEPWDVLVGMAKDYPRIAIGGMVGVPSQQKYDWVMECFQRVWPCRIHGFGVVNRKILTAVPFATVDATNWAYGASAIGNWRGLSPRGKGVRLRSRRTYNLAPEVNLYMRLQRLLKNKWAKELASLPALPSQQKAVAHV